MAGGACFELTHFIGELSTCDKRGWMDENNKVSICETNAKKDSHM